MASKERKDNAEEKDRILSGTVLPGEQPVEYSLRPKLLREFIDRKSTRLNSSHRL